MDWLSSVRHSLPTRSRVSPRLRRRRTRTFAAAVQQLEPRKLLSAANDDTYSVQSNATLNGNVSSNDQFSPPAMYSVLSGPQHYMSFSMSTDGSFTYTPMTGYTGTDTFSYYFTEMPMGTYYGTATITVTGANSAPTISLSNPVTVQEGQSGTLTATTSDPDNDTVTVAWDLDNDGDFDDGTGTSVTISANQFQGYGAQDGQARTVRARASDGQATTIAQTSVTVENGLPTVSSPAVTGTYATTPFNLTGTVSEVSSYDTVNVTINWGDGTTTSLTPFTGGSSQSVSSSHTYQTQGDYTVTVTANDGTGSSQSSTTVHVNPAYTINVPPTGPVLLEGETGAINTLSWVGAPGAIVGWTINWGDGSDPQYVTDAMVNSTGHMYVDDDPSETSVDTYHISLTPHTPTGTGTAVMLDAVVANRPPVLSSASLSHTSRRRNEVVDLTVGWTDVTSGVDDHTLTVDWGDGATETLDEEDLEEFREGTSHSFHHAYTADGDYEITVTVTDDDGGVATQTLYLAVADWRVKVKRASSPNKDGCASCGCRCPASKLSAAPSATGTNAVAGSATTNPASAGFGPAVGGLAQAANPAATNPHPIGKFRVEMSEYAIASSLETEFIYDDYESDPSESPTPAGVGFKGGVLVSRMADVPDAATGRVEWTMSVKAKYSDGYSDTTVLSGYDIVDNRRESPYGNRFWVDGVERLFIYDDGAALVRSSGVNTYFEGTPGGGYTVEPGSFASLSLNATTGFFELRSHGELLTFNSAGKMVGRQGAGTASYTYTYSGDLLTSITDVFGRQQYYTYSGGLISRITEFDGREWNYAHDGQGRMVSITGPGGAQYQFTYEDDETDLISTVIDENGGVTSYTYGGDRRLRGVTFPDGSTKTFNPVDIQSLDTAIRVEDETGAVLDERGNSSSLQADKFGNITRQTDAGGRVFTFKRDENGLALRSIQHSDPDGDGPLEELKIKYTYDELGRRTSARTVIDLDLNIPEDPENPDARDIDHVETWTYTGNLETPATYTNAMGQTRGWSWDEFGNLLAETDATGRTTTYEYDSLGQLIQVTDPAGAETDLDYDSVGNLVTLSLPNGGVWTWTYDAWGNALTETDPTGRTTTSTFDARDRALTITNTLNETFSFTYNGYGRILTTTDPLGRVSSNTWDNSGRLLTETLNDPDGAGIQLAPTTTYNYDIGGNVGWITAADGGVTHFTYDALNRIISTSFDPDGSGMRSAIVETYYYDDFDRVTSVSSTATGATFFTYDVLGRVLTATKSGIVTTYEYDAAGNLLTVIDALEGETSYTYDAAGRVLSETDRSGKVTEYTYDEAGRLETVRDALDHVTTYSYTSLGDIETITDALGRVTTYGYDLAGRLLSVTSPDPDAAGPLLALVTSYTYDGAGRILTVTDGAGATTTYTYNAAGDRLTSTNALGHTTTNTYDALGRLLTSTNPLNAVTSYTYDVMGRVLSVTLPDPDGAGALTAPVHSYTYDLAGNLLTATDPLGAVTAYDYGTNQLISRVTLPDPDGQMSGNIWSPLIDFTYDAFGRLTQTNDNNRVSSSTYDDIGRLTSTTDPLGNATTYDYDAVGRLLSVTLPGFGSPPHGDPIAFLNTYDDIGRLIARTDALGNVADYAYDAVGNLLSITQADPDGLGPATSPVTTYVYDDLDRLTSVTDPLGRVTTYTYDEDGRLESVTAPDPDGGGPLTAPVTSYGYDLLGRRTSVTDPTGHTTQYEYDFAGRVTKVTQPDPDGVGPLVAPETTYAYDLLGRLVEIEDAEAGLTILGYDAASRRTSLTDPEGNVTSWEYDFLGRMTTETNELGHDRTWSYSYGQNGVRLVDRTDRNGRLIRSHYDGLDRLIEEEWFDTDGTTLLDTREYTYDSLGRLLAAADGDASDTFEWDRAGNLRRTTQSGTGTALESDYDALHRRTSLSAKAPGTPDTIDDFVNEYTYDAAGRTTRITQHGVTGGNAVADKRIDFTYDALDRYTEVTRYEDLDGDIPVLESTYAYDAAGRLTELEHSGADGIDPLSLDPRPLTLLASYEWTYDAMGRLASATTPDGTVDYAYDATSQLTGADHTGGLPDEGYAYDANGNRVMTGHVVGPNNQLLSDGVWDYEYDAEGNLIRKENISTDESVEYTWDHRNQLTFVAFKDDQGNPTKLVAYEYDALGRKITKKVDDDADFDWDRGERYVYDAAGKTDSNGIGGLDDVVLVFDLAGSLTTRYLHGQRIDEIFADENALGEVLWALSDHQGTVRDLARFDSSTSSTEVVAHREIDSFGQIWGTIDPATSNPVSPISQEGEFRYAFTGREWDADVELYYFNARWYGPKIARFLSEDSIGIRSGDTNFGRYVENSPTNFTDPTGHRPDALYYSDENGNQTLASATSVLQQEEPPAEAELPGRGRPYTASDRAAAIREMKEKGLSEAEINLRLQIIENVANTKVRFDVDDYRDEEHWALDGGSFVPVGSAVEAIKALWDKDADNVIMCSKYSKLIIIKAMIDIAESLPPDERAKALEDIDCALFNAPVIPNDLPNEGDGVIFKFDEAEPESGGFANSELLPGDQIWFSNPYYEQLTDEQLAEDDRRRERGEKPRYPGDEGSNTFYIGNNNVIDIYTGLVESMDEHRDYMLTWPSVTDYQGDTRPSRNDFPVMDSNRPLIGSFPP